MSEDAKGVKDTIIKELIVEPEGIERESNYGRFVCLDPNGDPSELRFEDQVFGSKEHCCFICLSLFFSRVQGTLY